MTKRYAIGGVVLLLMGLMVPRAWADTGTLAPAPYLTVSNSSGAPISGACVWTYVAGTSTPANTYTSKAISVANSNPVIADASGQLVIYLVPGQSYKFVVETACTPPAHGAVLRTQDGIDAVPSSATGVDVTCTAGETIAAGLAVYLSDGSGGKTQGQCYKADNAAGFSSTTAGVVGIAPSAIASGASGTVRIAGSVPGLSGLTIGAAYFVGSSGALTSTPSVSVYPRQLGSADTTTSIILPLPSATPVDNGIDDFRLTLTSGTPVTTADVTGASAVTVFCTPAGRGNRIALFNASGVATIYTSAEFSIAVPSTTSQMYDVFAFSNAGVPTLELLAWTNDSTRATAIVTTTTGVYTKSGDLTRRYLGSMRTTTVAGQTEDSGNSATASGGVPKRYLWNYYNRAQRDLHRVETTASWPYTTNTYRQANAAAANQVEVIVGVADVRINLTLLAGAFSTVASNDAAVGIGEDSTTTVSASNVGGAFLSQLTSLSEVPVAAMLGKYPAVGRHFYTWLEKSNQSASGNVVTFVGAAATGTAPNGINGSIEGD